MILIGYRRFRCVGVIGGVFVCMGYAIRITSRAVDVVSGADQAQGTIAVEATGVRTGSGLRAKFTGSQLHARRSSLARVVQQGHRWAVENSTVGGNAPFGTPPPSSSAGSFTPASRPPSGIYGGGSPYSPYAPSPNLAPPALSVNGAGSPGMAQPGVGLGINSPSFGPAGAGSAAPSPSAFPTAATVGSPYAPTSPGMMSHSHPVPPSPRSRTPSSNYAHFPPTPNPATGNGLGFAPPPPPPPGGRKDE